MRLTLWYVCIFGLVLMLYLVLVFAFQYAFIKRQIFHDELQDVETVEGLLAFDAVGTLKLQQDYFSHPRSHLLIDRLMEVRSASGAVLYRSDSLNGQSLGGSALPKEGEDTFNEREANLADGTRILLISHTHPVQGRMLLIRVGYSLAPFRERMRQFLGILLIALPGSLVLIGFAGYLTTKRNLRPLEQMAARAETISSKNLSDRIEIDNPDDELGHMGRVLNLLLERLDQAFAQLQRFTGDAAHELRAPLACIRSVGELALKEESTQAEPYREALSSILEETAVLNQTVEDLLLLAKAEAAQPGVGRSTFSLLEVMTEVLTVLDVLIEELDLTVEQEGTGNNATVLADRGLVRAAFMNVLHNAVKFSPPRSRIAVAYRRPRAGEVEVSVQDGGPGVRADEGSAVFERFFTSTAKETSPKSGSGIGLSIARLAIQRSGGEIYFDTSAAHGARCIITLPVDATSPRPKEP